MSNHEKRLDGNLLNSIEEYIEQYGLEDSIKDLEYLTQDIEFKLQGLYKVHNEVLDKIVELKRYLINTRVIYEAIKDTNITDIGKRLVRLQSYFNRRGYYNTIILDDISNYLDEIAAGIMERESSDDALLSKAKVKASNLGWVTPCDLERISQVAEESSAFDD